MICFNYGTICINILRVGVEILRSSHNSSFNLKQTDKQTKTKHNKMQILTNFVSKQSAAETQSFSTIERKTC